MLQAVFIRWNLRPHLERMWVCPAPRFLMMREAEGVSCERPGLCEEGTQLLGGPRRNLGLHVPGGMPLRLPRNHLKPKKRGGKTVKRRGAPPCTVCSIHLHGGAAEAGEDEAQGPLLSLCHAPRDSPAQPHPVISKPGGCVSVTTPGWVPLGSPGRGSECV